jgi:hypothetical protein
MKLVSPYRDSCKLPGDASSVAYPHYEDHLIARYSQHQISSPANNLQVPQFRRGCPPHGSNGGGHASSPEPSVSPTPGADRSSSTGSCTSSLSEPVAGVNRRLSSYHRKKKVVHLDEPDVDIGACAKR